MFRLVTYFIHVDVQVYNQPPVQMNDRREVALKSPRMKNGGLIRAADSMISKGVTTRTISELVTDASSTIIALLGTVKHSHCIMRIMYGHCVGSDSRLSQVFHSLDVWHKAQKLGKAITEAGVHTGLCQLYIIRVTIWRFLVKLPFPVYNG